MPNADGEYTDASIIVKYLTLQKDKDPLSFANNVSHIFLCIHLVYEDTKLTSVGQSLSKGNYSSYNHIW